VERLTSEQIRLLEELRELRDSGILTVDEFELQVAKVLGRLLVVEPSPVDEETSAPAEVDGAVVGDISDEAIHEDHTVSDDGALTPETPPESELLEYEFVEPETSDIPAANIAESETQQNKSSRRKVLIGTTAGLMAIVVIALVALGGGKSDSTSSQIVDSTTTVTENASTDRTDAPTSPEDTQAPATSSQSGAMPTSVPQNASSGNASRPTTSTAEGSTLSTPSTIVNNVPPIVTDLKISKSSSVFYDYPSDLQQTVTITASILNDESEKLNDEYEVRGVSIAANIGGMWYQYASLERVQPGTWKITQDVSRLMPYGVVLSGTHKFCVFINSYPPCLGPSVTFEVLAQERNPPTISDFTVSPTRFFRGDKVRISVRIKDDTGLTFVRGQMCVGNNQGPCSGGDLSLVSGNEKDGLWAFEGVVGSEESAEQHCDTRLEVDIRAFGIYSNPDSGVLNEWVGIQNVPSGSCSLAGPG
jgi:hypothetical protein